ncbi:MULTISPECIES: virulence factor family protein [unclassified Pseudomonas]|uniref:virulence factor family protein n=1 Tax=unclassified Pseudomonas TaxID=196821 RepID=UPI000DA84646|nr:MULTISPECIES: AcvB/VirJ family lysyl-phosphatidylglycerol hydrolase [unclassified Pseudomonas]MDW3710362.1 AcvB/VirJ family lysyl-phosphatidylglycerol hydrolase [Pseudomonas sp. 2023EL-01195]PZE12658.1 virulence factor family protein [Pseudomonas sp. 57B-090624]
MLKRNWKRILVVALLLGIGVGLLLWSRPAPQARVEQKRLADGSSATLASPPAETKARVLVLVDSDQQLKEAELLALAHDGAARIVQLALPANDCDAQQHLLQNARDLLQGEPTLVAGIGPGAAFAWRWLAGQDKDEARALSIDFSLEHADCPTPLPKAAPHGHWTIAWNDNPDDPSAAFARGQANADTSISDYDTTLPQLLDEQLHALLQGEGTPMPVVEVPAAKPSSTVTLFYSGDGGWRDLDRAVAEEMAKRGHSVVGIDALRYFWQHKSPEQGAADLSRLMKQYREKWGAQRFVLAGYSFGADVLPAFYNRLPKADQQQVDAVLLLALARSGSFEIEVQGWLGKAGQEAPTGPELIKLPAEKVLCVYGKEEAGESGCTQPGAPGEVLALPGGHHYDENYPALAERLVAAIAKRQPAP